LSAGNIFIDANNKVKIGDFCKSRVEKTIIGEVKEDIFALGVILL
jgi:hypothetical protein